MVTQMVDRFEVGIAVRDDGVWCIGMQFPRIEIAELFWEEVWEKEQGNGRQDNNMIWILEGKGEAAGNKYLRQIKKLTTIKQLVKFVNQTQAKIDASNSARRDS